MCKCQNTDTQKIFTIPEGTYKLLQSNPIQAQKIKFICFINDGKNENKKPEKELEKIESLSITGTIEYPGNTGGNDNSGEIEQPGNNAGITIDESEKIKPERNTRTKTSGKNKTTKGKSGKSNF